jgi:hypothetical protein
MENSQYDDDLPRPTPMETLDHIVLRETQWIPLTLDKLGIKLSHNLRKKCRLR